MGKVEPFEKHTEEYEDWFDRNKFAYLSELEAIKSQLPKTGYGLEIGVRSGRFVAPSGINLGIEPCVFNFLNCAKEITSFSLNCDEEQCLNIKYLTK